MWKEGRRRFTYKSKVSTNDRARAEALCLAVQRLVPIAERCVVLAVSGVVVHGFDEDVAHGRVRHETSGPDLPVCQKKY